MAEEYKIKRKIRGRRRTFHIKDSSNWPSWFVKSVLKWLIKQVNVGYYDIYITLRHTNRVRHGHAYADRTVISTQRRPKCTWPKVETYGRYGDVAEKKLLNNAMEQFIHIVAHELRHLDRIQYGISTEGKEHDAEHWSYQRVDEFREIWPEMRRKIMEKLRSKRATKRRVTVKKDEQNTSSAKLEKAEAALAKWQKKIKHAETFVKKYKRSIRGLHAAQTRRRNAANPPQEKTSG